MLNKIDKAIILLERIENSIDYSCLEDYNDVIELLYQVQYEIKGGKRNG